MRRTSMANRARIVALLAVALLVRALVPTGWMPVSTERGVRLELCAGQDISPHAMAMHHGGRDKGGPAMADHPCAFAGLGLAADTTPPPLLLPVRPAPVATLAVERLAIAIGQGLAAPPPPATGPPTFA